MLRKSFATGVGVILVLVGAVLGWRWYTSSRTLEVENRSEITEQENLFIPFHNASYGLSLIHI